MYIKRLVQEWSHEGKELGCKDIYPGVHKFSKTFKSHLKILDDRRITGSKFRTEVTKLLVVTVKKLVAMATLRSGFVYPVLVDILKTSMYAAHS